MTRASLLRALVLTAVGTSAVAASSPPSRQASSASSPSARLSADTSPSSLQADLDAILDATPLARATIAARVESLTDGRILYRRYNSKLVVPASNMKIVTMAVAAERLGWNATFETTLEATGPVIDGTLRGNLIVTGGGDPSIGSPDDRPAQLFFEWADALRAAGIHGVTGQIIGDTRAFERDTLGAGWAWDYLSAGYATGSSALSYNENVAVVRIRPGAAEGATAQIALTPPGHQLSVTNEVVTSAAATSASVEFFRLPGSSDLTIRGHVPAGGPVVIRTAAVDRPAQFFLEALRLALLERGILVAKPSLVIDEGDAWPGESAVTAGGAERSNRRVVARHESEPLSSLIGYAMKVSQNFYGDMILKALGRTAGPVIAPASPTSSATAVASNRGKRAEPGSVEGGRAAVLDTLTSWGLPTDGLVLYDGSGLSRYNYATADLMVGVLAHVWRDERLRGPFVAALPVGGRDGTLEARMKTPELDRRVQAKTGTINNMRALSGYVETEAGEKLAFSFIANHYTAPSATVDAAVEACLARLVRVPFGVR